MPEGADADPESEMSPKVFEGPVRFLRDGGAECGFVSGVEGGALGGVAAGGDFAGLSEPLVKDADPLGGGRVFSRDSGVGQSGVAIGENTMS